MALINWCSAVKTVKNTKTNKTRYYIKRCDVWTRVSEENYNDRVADSNRRDSFHTSYRGDLVHNSMIVYGMHYSSD